MTRKLCRRHEPFRPYACPDCFVVLDKRNQCPECGETFAQPHDYWWMPRRYPQ
ncbi:MAG: hypothetical protein AB7L13_23840 [Acidimicrobiia bacterium]